MPDQTRDVRPTPFPRKVKTSEGKLLDIPAGWELLPPGDAALSRRIKQDGPTWTMAEQKGRKRFSKGVWAPAERIAALRAEREVEKADPAYTKQLEAGRARRAKEQVAYVSEFKASLLDYLNFHDAHADLAEGMAQAITDHAVPVGSGTVARTKRISIEARTEAATIAWMRHQTTAYDHLIIPREKGKRREVRRMLAAESKALLRQYRSKASMPASCPLRLALETA